MWLRIGLKTPKQAPKLFSINISAPLIFTIMFNKFVFKYSIIFFIIFIVSKSIAFADEPPPAPPPPPGDGEFGGKGLNGNQDASLEDDIYTLSILSFTYLLYHISRTKQKVKS